MPNYVDPEALDFQTEPPPRRNGGNLNGRPLVLANYIDQLKANPGQWAMIASNVTVGSGKRMAKNYPNVVTVERNSTPNEDGKMRCEVWATWDDDAEADSEAGMPTGAVI
jgi:hypothetical protein